MLERSQAAIKRVDEHIALFLVIYAEHHPVHDPAYHGERGAQIVGYVFEHRSAFLLRLAESAVCTLKLDICAQKLCRQSFKLRDTWLKKRELLLALMVHIDTSFVTQ
jgi:hypothetical protein